MLLGAAGSLLLARRVKRQTLGLEPSEIAGLVEQREAMLHGVREGVLGVDMRRPGGLRQRRGAAPARDASVRCPGRRWEDLGQEVEVTSILRGRAPRAGPGGCGRPPAAGLSTTSRWTVRGRQTGWVTSMRDRTELLGLQHELAESQAGTDTLRAQVHEFRNRMHAIGGMAELGRRPSWSIRPVRRWDSLDARPRRWAGPIEDPAVAALLRGQAEPGRRAGRGLLAGPGGPAGATTTRCCPPTWSPWSATSSTTRSRPSASRRPGP